MNSKKNGEKVLSLVQRADKAIDAHRYSLARERLKKALEIDPESVDAHFYLALAELRSGHLESAEKHARYVLKKEPRCPNARLNIGMIKRSQGDEAAAMRLYHRELKLHPECYEAHYNLGISYEPRGKWKRVLYHLEKCWHNHHHGKDLAEVLAWAAYKNGEENLEEEIYVSELGKDKNDTWALNNLAVIFLGRHSYSKARSLLRRAEALDPSDGMIKRNLKRVEEGLREATLAKKSKK